MDKKLTRAVRAALRASHRESRDRKVCDRIKAVLMYDDGYTYSEIARVLLIDDETVRRHLSDYYEKNKLSLASGGSHSALSDDQAEQLKNHLTERTYRYVKEICAYVYQVYGVKYSVGGMTLWLKHAGFCYKKPQPVPGKVDPISQAQFISYYKQLKRQAKECPIYFVDSVHPQHQTHLAYGWIKKGERKRIATTGKQKRLHFMGGLCLDGHKIVITQAQRIDADSIKQFLSQLRSRHKEKDKIHVIWDNAGYHRSQEVRDYAASLKIVIHYLPAYSPNLNPIERLWKLLHEEVSYNHYYEKFSDFKKATLDFFKHISRKKRLLRARLSDHFQIVQRPNFAF